MSWNTKSCCCGSLLVVDLLARSWVEMPIIKSPLKEASSRPPCEVVSWNIKIDRTISIGMVDLLARSWVEMVVSRIEYANWHGRPPCEVVSWNTSKQRVAIQQDMSTSLRGRELKCCEVLHYYTSYIVDLLARSWVEIIKQNQNCILSKSRPPCEVVSWNNQVESRSHFP